MRISAATLTLGESEGFAVALYDASEKRFVSSMAFDFKYSEKSGCYEWTFITPESGEAPIRLLLYAGLHGKTAGNSIFFEGITLTEWVK